MTEAVQHFPITTSRERSSAFWGCRDCAEGGKAEDASVRAAKHRRATNHATFWEFHSKGSFPAIDPSRALRMVPAQANRRSRPRPVVRLPQNKSTRVDRVVAEELVRTSGRADGFTAPDLMALLQCTWQQADGLRKYWQDRQTFVVEKRARQWRVFP